MPSHAAATAAIGKARKSDGKAIKPAEWRGNRLADALAKSAARPTRVDQLVLDQIDEMQEAAIYGAAFAGVTTHAANNHKVAVTRDDGSVMHRLVRDSVASRPGKRFPRRSRQKKGFHGNTIRKTFPRRHLFPRRRYDSDVETYFAESKTSKRQKVSTSRPWKRFPRHTTNLKRFHVEGIRRGRKKVSTKPPRWKRFPVGTIP